MEYLTLKQLSQQAGIPESTARYYRDKYSQFFQVRGDGRKRRYHPNTIDVLKFIAEQTQASQTQEQVDEGLSRKFTRVYDVSIETQRNNATTQQDPQFDLAELMKSQLLSQDKLTQAILRLAVASEERNKELSLEVNSLRLRLSNLEKKQGLPPAKADTEQEREPNAEAEATTKEDEKKPKRRRWWPFGK